MTKTRLIVYLCVAAFLALYAIQGAPLKFILVIAGLVIALDLTWGRMYRQDP